MKKTLLTLAALMLLSMTAPAVQPVQASVATVTSTEMDPDCSTGASRKSKTEDAAEDTEKAAKKAAKKTAKAAKKAAKATKKAAKKAGKATKKAAKKVGNAAKEGFNDVKDAFE
ncbi:MAG: hypothetical protein K6E86_08280 [Bacteroidales bacterium]|nr:hypothetical protein [Bacteroidales bacterium]